MRHILISPLAGEASSSMASNVLIGLIVVMILAGTLTLSRSKRKRLAAGRRQISSELAALDAALSSWTASATDADYLRAAQRRDQAQANLAMRGGPEDLHHARTDLTQAKHALATAHARLRGEDPPPEPDPAIVTHNGRKWYYHPGGEHNGRHYAAGYYDRSNFWEGLFLGAILAGPDAGEDERGGINEH